MAFVVFPVNSNNPCVYVGGNYSYNDNHGLFYLNCYSASDANGNIGSRHLVLSKHKARAVPCRLAEISPSGQGLVGSVSNNPEANKEEIMPKREGRLYEKMCDLETIKATILAGTRGKRKRKDVRRVLDDIEGYAARTKAMLETDAFTPTPPRLREIYDHSGCKKRVIHIVPYWPDGLVHQLAAEAMRPVVMRGMYRWSCASIPGRGNKCAADYVRRALDRDRKGTKYCLKMDIRKYYDSIDVGRLMDALRRKIKDERFLRLVESILRSNPRLGIAIGYYLNQWLANFYLEPLDGLILRQRGVRHYVRNMDDMVVFGASKRALHRVRERVEGFLRGAMGLELKGNWQVFPVAARGVDFVGYRFWPEHTTLRRRNFLRMARQSRRIQAAHARGEAVSRRMAAGFLSRAGQLGHCDGFRVREKYVRPVDVEGLKDVVRGRKAA